MSVQGPAPTTPTIILIGGRMTVDDGPTLDSRQPIRGDPWSEVTNKSLATSLLWWTVTSSLVDRLLDAGPRADAFAMVIDTRSVVEVRPDNTLRRTRLTSLLRGGSGTVKLERTSCSDPLPQGYQPTEVFKNWDNQVMGTVGFALEGSGFRWRLLEGNPYYLRNAGPDIGADVVVDTSQSLAVSGTGGSEWLAVVRAAWRSRTYSSTLTSL